MDQAQRDFAPVPRQEVLAGLKFLGRGETGGDALKVVAEPVGHQKALTVCCFDEVFEGVEFALMHHHRLVTLRVNRAGGQLQELA